MSRTFLTFIAGVIFAIGIPVMGQGFGLSFPDVPSTLPSAYDIERLTELGIIRGYENGRFGPANFITRAEMATVLNRYDQTVTQPLRDQLAVIQAKIGITSMCNGHAVGDAYASLDGCNTCTCTENGEVCTLRACVQSSSSRSSAKSTGPVCGNSICETGEDLYCPPCEAGKYCAQYCIAGSCMRDCRVSSSSSSAKTTVSCERYVCNDGTTIPACADDGQPIQYFAPPCMMHGGESDTSR